jgi:hypothetical protein
MVFVIDNKVTVLIQQCISCITVEKCLESIPKLLNIKVMVIWDVAVVW